MSTIKLLIEATPKPLAFLDDIGISNDAELTRKYGDGVYVQWSIGGPGPLAEPSTKANTVAFVGGVPKKLFLGRRDVSEPAALSWLEGQFGIKGWASSPFGGGKVPKAVIDAMKADMLKAV